MQRHVVTLMLIKKQVYSFQDYDFSAISQVYCEIYELALQLDIKIKFIPFKKLQKLKIPLSRHLMVLNKIREFMHNVLNNIIDKKYRMCL